ncbi:hypothetical protein MCHI_003659 [Candidatus Magnetoovum chiemensis]|nr:hypothetical protein MCHI_003659 [Candidatus Magnetoovum chiemensis]
MAEQIKEIDAIISKRRLSGKWPLTRVLYFISSLSEFDLSIERKKKRAIWIMAGFIAAGLVLGVIGDNKKIVFLKYCAFGSLFFAVISLFVMLRYRSLDLRNELREFIAPILQAIRDDIKKNTDISISLELCPIAKKINLTGRSDKYTDGRYYKCYDYYYERDFLEFGCRLADGNRLLLKGHEFLIKSVKTKKTSRGKIKTKHKYRKTTDFKIALQIDNANYSVKDTSNVNPAVTVKQEENAPVLCLKYKQKRKEDFVPDPALLLNRLALMYSFLQSSRNSV